MIWIMHQGHLYPFWPVHSIALASGLSIRVSGVRNPWLAFEKRAVLAGSTSATALARRRRLVRDASTTAEWAHRIHVIM